MNPARLQLGLADWLCMDKELRQVITGWQQDVVSVVLEF